MKIAVIGCGFVGETVANFLEKHLVDVTKVDPAKYTTTLSDTRDCEAFILCLPTPDNEDGSCDDSAIKAVIDMLNTSKPILLKSTVTSDLMQSYPDNVTYNPEFLRAQSAEKDFQNQEVFILGGNNEEHMQMWTNVFVPHLNEPLVRTMSRTDASMIKYTHNAWLALKVAFFHELFLNTRYTKDFNYSNLTSTLGFMKNIGPSHMIAPNTDGKFGYGGHCFPKDVKALTKLTNHSILKQLIESNKELTER
tara:strand:+ start:580 stop:1329 length:750 start_codon:yes stop_codon:yes gene_type:complete